MTDRKLAALYGKSVKSLLMVAVGERFFVREGPNDWYECDAQAAINYCEEIATGKREIPSA